MAEVIIYGVGLVTFRTGPGPCTRVAIGTNGQSWRMKATRSFFSSGESFSSMIRLKNSTVSSRVSSLPPWKKGGDSLMPRGGIGVRAATGRKEGAR
jgi:hypothetical protein